MTGDLDLEAIGTRVFEYDKTGTVSDRDHLIYWDIPALIAEVIRLRALSKSQSEAMDMMEKGLL